MLSLLVHKMHFLSAPNNHICMRVKCFYKNCGMLSHKHLHTLFLLQQSTTSSQELFQFSIFHRNSPFFLFSHSKFITVKICYKKESFSQWSSTFICHPSPACIIFLLHDGSCRHYDTRRRTTTMMR